MTIDQEDQTVSVASVQGSTSIHARATQGNSSSSALRADVSGVITVHSVSTILTSRRVYSSFRFFFLCVLSLSFSLSSFTDARTAPARRVKIQRGGRRCTEFQSSQFILPHLQTYWLDGGEKERERERKTGRVERGSERETRRKGGFVRPVYRGRK